jgi:hypothetical protein
MRHRNFIQPSRDGEPVTRASVTIFDPKREAIVLYLKASAAICASRFGSAAATRQHALPALQLGKGLNVEFTAAFVLEALAEFFPLRKL